MKRCSLVLALFAMVVGMPILVGHGEEPQEEPKKLDRALTKELSELMRRKLDNSQKVLEGIALNDFEKIAKHADELIAVSKLAEWRVLKTPQYELHSNDFRRIAETIVKEGKAKNIDGAVLAYVDLTLTCVKCHKHVREVRMTGLEQRDSATGE